MVLFLGQLDVLLELLPEEGGLWLQHRALPQSGGRLHEVVEPDEGLGLAIQVLDVFGVRNFGLVAVI